MEHLPVEVRSAMRRGGLLHRLTQVGFVAKGVVYLLVGVLALMLAAGGGGETTDAQGAVRHIFSQPFGSFALIAIAAGLLAFALWQFICAIFNTEHEDSDWGGRIKRAMFFCSGIAHSALALYAINLLRGHAQRGDQTRTWTARLMHAPLGSWLVMLVGVILIAACVVIIRGAFQERFLKDLRTSEMSSAEVLWATRAGKWGNAARSVMFGIIGLFMLFAGWGENPRKARGFERALDILAAQPFGNFLLGGVALGLALFGVYCMVEARYRRIRS